MGKIVSANLNRQEIIFVTKKYGITENEMGSFFKQMILDPVRTMNLNPDLVMNQTQKAENIIEENSISEIKNKKDQYTIEDLKKALKISNDMANTVDRKGLYTESNIESYVKKFLREWNSNLDKVPELLFRVSQMTKEEILMQELMHRMEANL